MCTFRAKLLWAAIQTWNYLTPNTPYNALLSGLGLLSKSGGLWGLQRQHMQNNMQNYLAQKQIKIIWFHAEIASKCCYMANTFSLICFRYWSGSRGCNDSHASTHGSTHSATSETFCAHRGQHSLASDGTAKLSKQGLHGKHLSPACWERQQRFGTKCKFTSVGCTIVREHKRLPFQLGHEPGSLRVTLCRCINLAHLLWASKEQSLGLGKSQGKKAGRVPMSKRINAVFDEESQNKSTGSQRKAYLPPPERRLAPLQLQCYLHAKISI